MPGSPASSSCRPRRAGASGAFAALLAAAALAGCASLQQPAPPLPALDTPSAWSAPAAAAAAATPAALAGWWQRFGDPALAPLVEQALAANADVLAAQARLRQARALRDGAEAGTRPSLSGGGSAQASRSAGQATREQYAASLDASWEADLWGAGAASVRAAAAAADASAATLAGTRTAIAAEVAANLLQWRGARARRAIALASLDNQQRTLQITQWRAEAGLVTQLDVEQARTAVEQTRAQIPLLDSSAALALNTLAVLGGRAPGTLGADLTPQDDGAALPAAPADLALALPAEVLRQRPDVFAAERQWLAAQAQVEVADAARLPSLRLGGSIGLSALSLGALDDGAGVGSLLASVSLPLLDGGRVRAQLRVQEAARDEAAARYRATLLAALQDVEDTLRELRATQEQLVALRAAAASARAAATLAEQRYRSGLVDFQNVLQTQRTLLSAEDGVASAATALATRHVQLYRALGGGWEPLALASPDAGTTTTPR